jgi:hypothetical protein
MYMVSFAEAVTHIGEPSFSIDTRAVTRNQASFATCYNNIDEKLLMTIEKKTSIRLLEAPSHHHYVNNELSHAVFFRRVGVQNFCNIDTDLVFGEPVNVKGFQDGVLEEGRLVKVREDVSVHHLRPRRTIHNPGIEPVIKGVERIGVGIAEATIGRTAFPE